MYRDMYIYSFLCVGQAILSRAGPFIWESLSFIYQTEAAKMKIGVILSCGWCDGGVVECARAISIDKACGTGALIRPADLVNLRACGPCHDTK